MRKVVFDIETKNIFRDVGENNPALLDISVVGIYDSATNSYKSFLEGEFKELWPIIEKTDLLIGYNSEHFDIPLLNKYYHGDISKIKSLDILKEIRSSVGRRMRLDQVAEGTLGIRKSGDGIQAITWWKNGEIEKVRKYCLDDVKITKELYDYAVKNGELKYKEGGKIMTIKLDTSTWENRVESAMTHSLPF